jgi:ubiquinone/menaquinone biosynthesis C-methylase UbiE
MPDIYATIADADTAEVERLADILEVRAADERQRTMRETYLSGVDFRGAAQVVEVGCGSGAVARSLAATPGVGEVVGIDPSPVLLARARELARGIANLTFVEGDARALPLESESVDVLVFHTLLCHVPEPDRALAEAFRVIRQGGSLAIFDGDYATATCALLDRDPLQACVDAVMEFLVHDPYLVRRLPGLAAEAGFEIGRLRGHSYVDSPTASDYMLSLVDRGADLLASSGRIGQTTADALKAEARRRSEVHEFFGHIAYGSLIARKPAR